ncbi:hypothetical protein BCV70DRAFT_226803 [Testicularia cyperi]|uniref:Chromo domain-containing protein n=1 Tax=Testicularia cyperi TaxID=1882483 RepID=A0A317XPJ0_9BASI|nr:hypothetical protein BCV70DRAFT_226803 [Testicularia cyperi]
MVAGTRARSSSAHVSPRKENGHARSKPATISMDISDDEDDDTKPSDSKSDKDAIEIESDGDEEEVEAGDNDDVEDDEYEVEKIRSHRHTKGKEAWKMEYLVKWKGWPESANTWEPETNFSEGMVNTYWKSQPSKSQPKKFEKESKKRKADLSDEYSDADDNGAEEEKESESEDEVEEVEDDKPVRSSSRRSRKSARTPPSSSSKRKSRKAESESEEEDDDEDEDEDRRRPAKKRSDSDSESEAESTSPKEREQRALKKIKDRFLEHYQTRDDWEDRVLSVNNMMRDPEDSMLRCQLQFDKDAQWTRAMKKLGKDDLARDGPELWVPNKIANVKCPHKIIQFYEKHVKFSAPPKPRK